MTQPETTPAKLNLDLPSRRPAIPDHVRLALKSAGDLAASLRMDAPPRPDDSKPFTQTPLRMEPVEKEPSVTLYASLGSKHVGGKTFRNDFGNYTFGNTYSQPVYDPKKNVYYSTSTVTINGNDGTFNLPYNEHNPGGSVSVLWPITNVGKNKIEAGVSAGSYFNSFYESSTFLAGNVALRNPNLWQNGNTPISGAIGVELGAINGYRAPVGGQIYAEVCTAKIAAVSICAKVGLIPAIHRRYNVETMNGTVVGTAKYEGVQRGEFIYFSDAPITASSITPPLPPHSSRAGVAVTAQIGIRF
jgi:hypothetical protein